MKSIIEKVILVHKLLNKQFIRDQKSAPNSNSGTLILHKLRLNKDTMAQKAEIVP